MWRRFIGQDSSVSMPANKPFSFVRATFSFFPPRGEPGLPIQKLPIYGNNSYTWQECLAGTVVRFATLRDPLATHCPGVERKLGSAGPSLECVGSMRKIGDAAILGTRMESSPTTRCSPPVEERVNRLAVVDW